MLDVKNTAIICIDIQEKLVDMLKNSEQIRNNTTKLMKAAEILNIKKIITEQYPKGLGFTIPEIKTISDFKAIEKTDFSAFSNEEFEDTFDSLDCENIVIFGIETHICVYQTVMNLLDEGCNVYVVTDCCASRSEFNHNTALELMKQEGAKIVSLEMVLFEFLKSSRHPHFKEIQTLIK